MSQLHGLMGEDGPAGPTSDWNLHRLKKTPGEPGGWLKVRRLHCATYCAEVAALLINSGRL